MKQKIEFAYQDDYINALSQHFARLPSYFMREELEDFGIIHPNGKENFEEIINGETTIQQGSVAQEIEANGLRKHGGIYYIAIPNTKTLYVGETLDFERRFSKHLEDFQNNKHSNKKMQKAYNQANGEISFVILEQGTVTNYNKAEFKLYCMKRENYYKELFRNHGRGLFNLEDTLHVFYVTFDSVYGYHGLGAKVLCRSKTHRAQNMEDLEAEARIGVTAPPSRIITEEHRYEMIQKTLANRYNR